MDSQASQVSACASLRFIDILSCQQSVGELAAVVGHRGVGSPSLPIEEPPGVDSTPTLSRAVWGSLVLPANRHTWALSILTTVERSLPVTIAAMRLPS